VGKVHLSEIISSVELYCFNIGGGLHSEWMICYGFLYTISHLIMHYMPYMLLGLEITSYIKYIFTITNTYKNVAFFTSTSSLHFYFTKLRSNQLIQPKWDKHFIDLKSRNVIFKFVWFSIFYISPYYASHALYVVGFGNNLLLY
jgi:hypothetical protein